jgi:RNA polymerase sigma-70 factor (ECF subfamily)
MSGVANESGFLMERARPGETEALRALFDHYRDRLRRMVRLRLDRRLTGTIRSDTVLQSAYQGAARSRGRG